MSEEVVEKLNALIKPIEAKLTTYSGDKIDIMGETTGQCFHRGNKYFLKFIFATSAET